MSAPKILPYVWQPAIRGTTLTSRVHHKTNRRIYEATARIPCSFCPGSIDQGDLFIMQRKEHKTSGQYARVYPACNDCINFTVTLAKDFKIAS